MAINEIFPNPTVKHVIFQIKFPNLFSMESKIGDLQLKIMKEFPESALLYQKQFVLANLGPGANLEDIRPGTDSAVSKIWQFKSDNQCVLQVTTETLSIASDFYKTYARENEGGKFRDPISLVLQSFFEVTRIPLVHRVGLRYIDECPMPGKDNATFAEYYNSTFPLDRFPIEYASEMFFRTVVRKGDFNLMYAECIKAQDGQSVLVLDFDGFAENVLAEACLSTTDALHEMISNEYECSIREPVYEYMRKEKEI